MALVRPNLHAPSAKAFVTAAISTNADGTTGADVVDCTGYALASLELSSVCTDANYSFNVSMSSSAILKTLMTTTGGVLTYGTTGAGVTSGRTMQFDPAFWCGVRYIQVVSGTTAAPIANATGAAANLGFCVFGAVK